jgi:S1-C subfamily serine protease
MTIQQEQGQAVPPTVVGPVGGQPQWGQPDPWTSDLWARPDTVGGYTRPPDQPPPAPADWPPPPQRPRRRGLLVVAAVLVAALLAGGAALAATLRSDDTTTAAPPTPTARPTLPSTPSPAPTNPPSAAPSAPGIVPGPQNGAGQPGTLTPQQSAATAAVSKGLVDITTTLSGGSRGAGTGVVLSADGLVLTNHHVVEGATSVRATDVGNGQTYDATVLGYDATHDVAVIRLSGASGLTVAPLGDSSTVKVGDKVVAVGNAGGVGGTPSAVPGTVTGLDRPITVRDEIDGSSRRLTGLIEIDAAIQPGDSGGALVDAGGKVVGIITAGSVAPGGGDGSSAVDGYAVPINQAHSIAQQIIAGQPSSTVHIGATGYLGVQVVPDSPLGSAVAGVPVADVVSGSAAEGAGIEPGDVITAVDGTAVTSTAELHAALAPHKPGDSVTVAWTDQAGQHHTATVRLGTGPVG